MTPYQELKLKPLSKEEHVCNLDVKVMIARQYVYAVCVDCGKEFEQFS